MTIEPDTTLGLRHVFVRGLTVQARLGVYAHEKIQSQRVVINIDLSVRDPHAPATEGHPGSGRAPAGLRQVAPAALSRP